MFCPQNFKISGCHGKVSWSSHWVRQLMCQLTVMFSLWFCGIKKLKLWFVLASHRRCGLLDFYDLYLVVTLDAFPAGKTREMIQVLDNYFLDPRPKVPIFPKDLHCHTEKSCGMIYWDGCQEPVCRNFYVELLRWPSRFPHQFNRSNISLFWKVNNFSAGIETSSPVWGRDSRTTFSAGGMVLWKKCSRPQDAAKASGCSTWRSCRSQLWDLRVSWQQDLVVGPLDFVVWLMGGQLIWLKMMILGTARTWIERTLQQFERNLGDEGMDAWTKKWSIPPTTCLSS